MATVKTRCGQRCPCEDRPPSGHRRVRPRSFATTGYTTSLVGPVALLLGLSGCGAKTGLDIPDGGPRPDAGFDAGVPVVDVPCIETPFEGGPVEVPLEIEAELARADVLFLVDVTLSMEEEIDQIRQGLRDRIAPGTSAAVPDSMFGVATFADFPSGMCGEPSDRPFELLLPVTDDLSRVQAALDGINLGNGLDRPESHVEALYQTVTGEGIGPYVTPSFGCPGGGAGYPCFRPDALPVILLFSDAPFHNGPGGSNPYRCPISPPPHTYRDAVTVLNQLGAKVVGMYSGDGEGEADLRTLARDTGAVEGTRSLVFNIGTRGQRLSTSVVGAVRTLADVIEFDVDTILLDPDTTDGVDPRDFVASVVPLRADPMNRVRGIDAANGAFLGVRAGTRVFFQLNIDNNAVVPGPTAQRFRLEIIFRGDRRTRLGSRLVEVVVPGADGSGCGDQRSPGG